MMNVVAEEALVKASIHKLHTTFEAGRQKEGPVRL